MNHPELTLINLEQQIIAGRELLPRLHLAHLHDQRQKIRDTMKAMANQAAKHPERVSVKTLYNDAGQELFTLACILGVKGTFRAYRGAKDVTACVMGVVKNG